ncbi:MAG: hypothetical protein M1814_002329, partial [Vezdaea aestivalis]
MSSIPRFLDLSSFFVDSDWQYGPDHRGLGHCVGVGKELQAGVPDAADNWSASISAWACVPIYATPPKKTSAVPALSRNIRTPSPIPHLMPTMHPPDSISVMQAPGSSAVIQQTKTSQPN